MALGSAQAVVVLMSPDDEAKLRDDFLGESDGDHERNLTPQARQNVLFEAGLSMGRAADRTILVEVGHLRPFSDIAGRHTIRLDNSTEKRQDVANRMETAGCEGNLLGGTDWQLVGNFEISESASTAPKRYSPPPATEHQIDLHQEQVSILLELSKLDSAGRGSNVNEIAQTMDIVATRAQYHLDKLKSDDYLDVTYFIDTRVSRYRLSAGGRTYLFERGLI